MTAISNWANVSDFISMGGYGLYVWGSFGMAAAVMAVECVALRSRRRALAESAAPEPGVAATAPPRSAADFKAVAHEA